MPVETTISANVTQAAPFFGVTNMEASLQFYVGGLGFTMKRWWIPDRVDSQDDDKSDGRVRWCWLELGEAAIMLQEFSPERRLKETLGSGVNVCFQCKDALTLYREFKSRGVQARNRPFVGNGLWIVPVTDPDGYRMEFSRKNGDKRPVADPLRFALSKNDLHGQAHLPTQANGGLEWGTHHFFILLGE